MITEPPPNPDFAIHPSAPEGAPLRGGRLVVLSLVTLLGLAGLAVASLFFRVGPPPESETRSPFGVTGNTITIPDAAAQRIGLETVAAVAKDEPVVARFTGRTGFNLERLTHVKAQFAGRIAEIGPALGSRVQGPAPGIQPTLLCVVESVDLGNAKNAYQKAVVQLELDQEALERTIQMVKENVLGPKFIIDAEVAVKKDKADVEIARQSLFVFGLTEGDLARIRDQIAQERMVYEIRSPISGVIAEKNVTRGEFADNTVNLFTVVETSTMWVWGDVYEKDWRKVRVGQRMKVILAAYPELSLDCTVDLVSPNIDVSTRSIRIRGTLDNSSQKILSDMYGTLLVTVDAGVGSIIIPSISVVRALKQDQAYVFVRRTLAADGSGAYERVPVTVEAVDIDHARVTKGLVPGDRVVTQGALNLFDEMEHH